MGTILTVILVLPIMAVPALTISLISAGIIGGSELSRLDALRLAVALGTQLSRERQ